MNATRQTATIFPTELNNSAHGCSSPRFVRRPRVGFDQMSARVPTVTLSFSIRDVCELIEAAGPLPLRDIAGGLDVPAQHISRVVSQMTAENLLGEDEWGRYRVCGGCR